MHLSKSLPFWQDTLCLQKIIVLELGRWKPSCLGPSTLSTRHFHPLLGLQFGLLPSHPPWHTGKPHIWWTRALLLEELVLQTCFPALCSLSSYVVSKVEFPVLFLAWATVLFISWMRKWIRKTKKTKNWFEEPWETWVYITSWEMEIKIRLVRTASSGEDVQDKTQARSHHDCWINRNKFKKLTLKNIRDLWKH